MSATEVLWGTQLTSWARRGAKWHLQAIRGAVGAGSARVPLPRDAEVSRFALQDGHTSTINPDMGLVMSQAMTIGPRRDMSDWRGAPGGHLHTLTWSTLVMLVVALPPTE